MKKIIHNIAAAGLVLSFILVLGAAGALDCGEDWSLVLQGIKRALIIFAISGITFLTTFSSSDKKRRRDRNY